MAVMKPQSARRREVRKNIPRRASAFRAWVSRRDVMWGALYGLVFVVLGGLIVREGRMEPDYRVQQLVDRPVVSRSAFESVSPMRTEQAREDAESRTPAIYRPNVSFLDEMRERLLHLPSTVQSVESLADAEPSLREEFAFTEQALATLKSHLREGEADTQEASAVWRANVEGLISNLVRGRGTYDGRNLRRRAVLIT
ncbi:MAG: hypothetical protein CMJ49_06800, partial [Planctomycetaceae bacterium]|nr:hypothetical protein [Planctomycetaceae bacterium]